MVSSAEHAATPANSGADEVGSDTTELRASPRVTSDRRSPRAADRPEVNEGTDGILTVPNVVTLVRLSCLPLFVWLVFGAQQQTGAALLLGALGATDWVDGYVARRLRQVSTLGKVLDPVADRLLMGTAVIVIIVQGAVPLWFGVLTLAREALVSVITLVLGAFGAERIDVLWVGKAGTFALMFAYPAFLISHGSAGWQLPFYAFAWLAGAIGLVLAWIAAFAYVVPARRALAAGRAARRTS